MVLATKLKNTKLFTKVLCIALSIVLAFGASFCAVNAILAVGSFGEKALYVERIGDNYSLVDVNAFRYSVMEDLSTASVCCINKMNPDVKKEILSHKDDFVNYVLKCQKKQRADYAAEYLQDYDDEFDEDGEVLSTTMVDYSTYNDIVGFDYSIDLGYTKVSLNSQYVYENDAVQEIYLSDSAKVVKSKLDTFLEEYTSEKYIDYTNYYDDDINTGFFYYVKNNANGFEMSKLPDGVSKKDIASMPYSYTYINGKESFSPELEEIKDRLGSYASSDDIDVRFYIDFNELGRYHNIRDFYNYIQTVNTKSYVVAGSVMLLMSLALAIFAFCVAGKRREDGKIKLAFIDYVPFEIHTAISGGGVAGLIALFVTVLESMSPYLMGYSIDVPGGVLVALASLCTAGIWALFIEWMTSLVRTCKSDKHFYKNTLIFWILYALFIGAKKLAVSAKKSAKRTKESLSYKPHHFTKLLIGWIVGYVLLNVVLVIAEMCCVIGAWENDGVAVLGVMIALVFFAINIASLVYVVVYFKDLDKIIVAAHERIAPQVDYNKLPNSLKLLVSSLQYSNQELQSAVSKAVRDERMRSELITNVSHDLKTPLTSIINYVDLLEQCDIQDDTAKEYISVLDEKSGKLKRLIDDLIEASKITSGVITLNPVQINLSELATQAIVDTQRDFEDRGLELIFKGDKNSATAFCDGNKTYRVIENLLSNAKKYSARGSRVYADVYSGDTYSVFEIKNMSATPLDITPDELIERFVRGDKSRTNEGNGLGLSIADNLTKAMNGKLVISIDGDLFKAQVYLPKQ